MCAHVYVCVWYNVGALWQWVSGERRGQPWCCEAAPPAVMTGH